MQPSVHLQREEQQRPPSTPPRPPDLQQEQTAEQRQRHSDATHNNSLHPSPATAAREASQTASSSSPHTSSASHSSLTSPHQAGQQQQQHHAADSHSPSQYHADQSSSSSSSSSSSTSSSHELNKVRAAVEESPDAKWARYPIKLGAGTFKVSSGAARCIHQLSSCSPRSPSLCLSLSSQDVWLAIDTETGKEVAWNVVDFRRVAAKDQQRIRHETALLTQLRHPHIIEIYDVWENVQRQTLCFITQKSSYTLKQHIANLHPAKLKVIKKYCRQILSALEYLHGLQPPIIHRDIKADNIFIDGTTGDIRIGDFGLSISSSNPTSIVGTPGFLSPEMFGESYNELVDIWSFGMCVLEMATNQYPYVEYNGSVAQLLKKGFEGAKPEALHAVPDASMRDFIAMCLQSADKRPSAKQLLEQKVFDLTETSRPASHSAVQSAAIKLVGDGDKDEAAKSKAAAAAAATAASNAAVAHANSHSSSKVAVTVTPRPDPPPARTESDPVLHSAPAAAASASHSAPTSPNIPSASLAAASSAVAGRQSPHISSPLEQPTGHLAFPAPSPLSLAQSSGPSPPAASLAPPPVATAANALTVTPSVSTTAASPASSASASASPASAASLPSSPSALLPSSLASSIGTSSPSRMSDPKRDLLRRRAESLIPRVSVSKTAELSVVSIVLYVHFPSAKQIKQARKERKERQQQAGAADASDTAEEDGEDAGEADDKDKLTAAASTVRDVTEAHREQQQQDAGCAAAVPPSLPSTPSSASSTPPAAGAAASPSWSPPLSAPSSPVTSGELLPISIPSYDFSRDNYLAVATDLVHRLPAFSTLELEGVEELVAIRIEEGTRERYNKWHAKARTTLNSEIMTLLTSLGIGLNYAVSFIEQEVSIEDLPFLSEDDLAAFIPKLGPRRRLQQYIADIRASKRLVGVEEEEGEGGSEEEREEERKRRRKDREAKADKGDKKKAEREGKDKDKDREKEKGDGRSGEKLKEKDKDKARKEKDKDREKDRQQQSQQQQQQQQAKADKKREEEEADLPRLKERSSSVNPKLKEKDRGERDKDREKEREKGGSKERAAEKEKEKEKEKDRERKERTQGREAEKDRDRSAATERKDKVRKETEEGAGGSLLLDRVERSARERKLTVSRPSSALSNTSPSVPGSPGSAQSDGGSDAEWRTRGDERGARRDDSREGRAAAADTEPDARERERGAGGSGGGGGRKSRADSDTDADFTGRSRSGSVEASQLSPSKLPPTAASQSQSASAASSTSSTPELRVQRRVNSLTGMEAASKLTARTADRDRGEKDREKERGAGGMKERGDRERDREKDRRVFVDDAADTSGMNALLSKIGNELLDPKLKAAAPTAAAAAGRSGAAAGGEVSKAHSVVVTTPAVGGAVNHVNAAASAFALSGPVVATPVLTSNGSGSSNTSMPLTRVASTPNQPLGSTGALPPASPSSARSAVSGYLQQQQPSQQPHSSSRPNSPTRRQSQPFLFGAGNMQPLQLSSALAAPLPHAASAVNLSLSPPAGSAQLHNGLDAAAIRPALPPYPPTAEFLSFASAYSPAMPALSLPLPASSAPSPSAFAPLPVHGLVQAAPLPARRLHGAKDPTAAAASASLLPAPPPQSLSRLS